MRKPCRMWMPSRLGWVSYQLHFFSLLLVSFSFSPSPTCLFFLSLTSSPTCPVCPSPINMSWCLLVFSISSSSSHCHSPLTSITPFKFPAISLSVSRIFSLLLHPSHSLSSPARYPAIRHQDSNCWKPRVDLWPGVYGWPDQAGFLLLPLCFQTQTGELWECPVATHQLHLPAGLWGHCAGLQDLWLPLVSNP